MNLRILLGVSLFVLPLSAGVGRAQAVPDECAGLSGINEASNSEVNACLKPIINAQSLISVSDTVRRVVSGELAGGGPAEPEPAGLVLSGSQDIAARLAADGTVTVEPTADVPATVTEQRLWNSWIDGKYSWIDGQSGLDDSEGPLINAIIGIDYRLSSRVVLGVLGTYETSRLETGGVSPIRQETEGFGGGAYIGVTVTPNIVFSGLATYAAIDTELGLSSDGKTDSDRIQLSGGFTGYWYFGTTRLSPSVTLAWSKEWQDAYSNGVDPAQKFETGVLTGGSAIGHTFAIAGTTSIEPWLGAFIDYTFLNETDTDGVGTDSFDEQADLRLQAGLTLNLASNVQLMLIGETAGLIVDESDTYAGEANLAIQF